jgi:hypothetical protein
MITENLSMLEAAMVNDAEARNVVCKLMQRCDLIDAQHASLSHVLAKKDPQEYTRLLETAERINPMITQVLATISDSRRQAYAAIEDPNADWCNAVISWLDERGPITLSREQTYKVMGLMLSNEPDL